jgi:hypothetical protein
VGIVVINSQEGRTSSLPKVSEAVDYQLQREISRRQKLSLALLRGEVPKCKYRELAGNTSTVSLRRLVRSSATWV